MSMSTPFIKQIEFFRKERNDSYFEVIYEQRKLKKQYIYERGVEDYDDIILIKIGRGNLCGIGECSPLPSFFGWTVEMVLSDLKNLADDILLEKNINHLESSISSAAYSGITMALLDLQCHQRKLSISDMYQLPLFKNIIISHTVEYDVLGEISHRLSEMTHLPLLKVKLGSDGLDEERLKLVRYYAPNAKIIIDVNEGWTFSYLKSVMPLLLDFNVEMIEQPLKRGEDYYLMDYKSPIPIYADESLMKISDLEKLSTCYSGFNIKLDKIGGFANALNAINHCRHKGKNIMVGCLGGTSLLSTAGFVVAQFADFVDLDNHLWLCQDQEPALGGENGMINVPQNWLWGSPI